jgi:Actin
VYSNSNYIDAIMSSSYYSGNNSNSIEAVVVDIGAGLTKMGWAGDDYPRSIFRSVRCECMFYIYRYVSKNAGFLTLLFYFLRVC